MPLVSALAASHAPNILLEPGSEWEDFMDLHYSMAPTGSSNRPTLAQQKKLRQDAEAAFAVLREDLQRSRPDVLVVVVALRYSYWKQDAAGETVDTRSAETVG